MADGAYDILVVGGGINGAGIARDAAGRGHRVALAEMGDLASGTSSWSTKLIHGGLRYLEHYEFRLVREALREREVLWAMAPHIIRPLRFVLPHHRGLQALLAPPDGALPLRPHRRARRAAGHPHARPQDRPRRRAAARRVRPRASSIPTAGSRTRGSWCSTPATPRTAGPRS